jgi:hypothetical protein
MADTVAGDSAVFVQSTNWPRLLAEQFILGNAGFALCFWPFGGKKALAGFGNEYNLSPLTAMFGASLGVHFATYIDDEKRGPWVLGPVGAFCGMMASAFIFPQLYHGEHPTATYIVFSTVSTLGAMLVYDFMREHMH